MRHGSSFVLIILLTLSAPVAHAQISHSTWGQGGIRVGDSTTTCDAAAEGSVKYNDTTNVHEFCNGTAWANIGGSAAAAGADTQVQFNDGGTALGGDSGMVFNKTTNALTITGPGNMTTSYALGTNAPLTVTDLTTGDIFRPLITTSSNGEGVLQMVTAASHQFLNPEIWTRRSRGTLASRNIVADGDEIFCINNAAYDGSNWPLVATICSYIDGTPGTNDMPGRIEFSTTPDGSATQVLRMTIKNDGNVGIGTATPGAALHVVGDIHFTGVIADVSDRRLKEHIQPLGSNQIEKITKLQGVSFTMRGSNETELGLIAQDVETVYPDLVQATPDGTKSMNYIGLIAPLIEAIKEQQRQIEMLETRVELFEKGTAQPKCDRPTPGKYNQ